MAVRPTIHPKTPKYVKLAEHLRAQIEGGALLPAQRVPSFPQLRSEFQISQNTVEKAHALLEEDGLIVREQGRGTFVAERSRRASTHAIGVAGFHAAQKHSPYWAHLMEGIQSAAHEAEMEVVLLRPGATRGLERVDGILAHVHDDGQLPGRGVLIPTVAFMSVLPELPCVVADDFDGALQATRHLLELGHRKIATLFFQGDPINQRRLAGYRAALREAKINARRHWSRQIEICAPSQREAGAMNVTQWLETDWRKLGCTAILCQNDQFAIGAMRAFQQAGWNVPRDVSVVGFDGTEEAEYSAPHLTSVQVPLEEVGRRAAELLLRKTRGEELEKINITLPVQLVTRASTGAAKV